ncbi:MAG: hypothetical protein ACR2RE_10585, partial [Geminicoccaceae bacterium]
SEKLVFREIFETGRRHKKYESRPLQNVNREKILIRHPFGTDYPQNCYASCRSTDERHGRFGG